MEIDVVIPVSSNTRNKTIELIYAIRSLQKNLKGFGQLFVCGEKDNRLEGVKYINCKDDKSSKYKERNIYRKILAACNDDRLSENFIFTNDDIFLTQEFNAEQLPFYHKGELSNTMLKNSGDYRKSLNHSRKFLEKMAKRTLDYDTHFPIVYNKTDFLHIFVHNNNLNWEQPFGYVIKSLYCNMKNVKGEYGGDCKVQAKMSYEELKQKVSGKSFFSTSDGAINDDMIRLLEELYPQKSIYER